MESSNTLLKRKINKLINFLGIEDLYNSLSSEKQKLLFFYLKKASDGFDVISLFEQSPKRLIELMAYSAYLKKDYELAIPLAKKGLSTEGSAVSQHFIYNLLIEYYARQKNYEECKRSVC